MFFVSHFLSMCDDECDGSAIFWSHFITYRKSVSLCLCTHFFVSAFLDVKKPVNDRPSFSSLLSLFPSAYSISQALAGVHRPTFTQCVQPNQINLIQESGKTMYSLFDASF